MTLKEKYQLPQIKVDIGCGFIKKTSEEYIWVDGDKRVKCDIHADFGYLPFEDNSVDEIVCNDIIEHIPQYRYNEVLTEFNRILKLGGKIKGACPNLHSTMIRYANNEVSLSDALGAIYGSGENEFQVHYNGFTIFTLQDLLTEYGFGFIDFNESPGSEYPMESWWIVFTGEKIKDLLNT